MNLGVMLSMLFLGRVTQSKIGNRWGAKVLFKKNPWYQGTVHPTVRPQRGTSPEEGVPMWAPGGQAFPMGSSQAQPEEKTWFLPPVGSPPTGRAIAVQCYLDRVTVKDRFLGYSILSGQSIYWRFCWECLGEDPARMFFRHQLQQSFNHIPKVMEDVVFECAVFLTAITEVAVWSCGIKLASASHASNPKASWLTQCIADLWDSWVSTQLKSSQVFFG